jgi:hypothetical protein
MKKFEFKDYPPLTDGEIDLVVEEKRPAGFHPGWVPSYEYYICLHGKSEPIGHIALRIGNMKNISMYGGHIGYRILKRTEAIIMPLRPATSLNRWHWITDSKRCGLPATRIIPLPARPASR